MPLRPNILETVKQGYQGPTQPIVSIRPSLTWTQHNLRDGAMCTTRYRASASLEVRLENRSATCFQVKQAAQISTRVPHCPPSVGFVVQLTNRSLHGFETQIKKLSR
jgi:hypothetical protein